MQFDQDRNLREFNTLRISVIARFFKEVRSVPDLQEVLKYCHRMQLKYLILGKGSNLLFTGLGFNGLVVLNKISFIESCGEGEYFVGAGYSFASLGLETSKRGWGGLEFARGIPGSIGGAVYMNAGSGGNDTFSALKEVVYVDEIGELHFIPKNQMKWGYRFSSFQGQKGAIAAARFQLYRSENASKIQKAMFACRLKTQPYRERSLGCVFKNPNGQFAGQLIEACGLKGFRIGDAEISERHANFIINRKAVTGEQFLELVRYVQKTVHDQTGQNLIMEIQVVPP